MPRMQRPLILLAAALALLSLASPAQAAKRKVPHGFYAVMWDRAATDAPDADAGAAVGADGEQRSRVRAHRLQLGARPAPARRDRLLVHRHIVELAASHNIDLVPVVRTTPAWAALNPFARGSPPASPSSYTAYLRGLIDRYGPNGTFWVDHPELPKRPVRTWQIWNEPHLNVWWNTDGRSPNAWAREYAALLKAVRPVVRAADPGAKIVLAALADYTWQHLARLNKFKIGRYYDVAAINLFTSKPANVIRGVRLFRRVMRRGGAARKPVWLTEATWPAGKGRVTRPQTSWQRAWYTTDQGMAKRVGDIYKLAIKYRRKLKLGKVVWYTWSSQYSNNDLFDYSGLNLFAGGVSEQRPALAAYAASARRYQGCVKTAEGACQ